jgi:hypothetical protein
MSSLSLTKSIRTCKVDTGKAEQIQTDRFFNPNNMVCIPWGGHNNKGQKVCLDSWYTKTPGCNSAMDRVVVENDLRPDYADNINLNTSGIDGNIYENQSQWTNSGRANKWLDERNLLTGNFGLQYQADVQSGCTLGAYENAMAEESQNNRQQQFAAHGYNSHGQRIASGY